MSSPSRIWSLPKGLLVVSVVVVVAFARPGFLRAQGGGETTRKTAPDFRLSTVKGTEFHLEEHRGEVVVLNFWATWCPPCRREIPDFVELQRTFGEQGLQFVGVALERNAGVERVRKFANKMNINYPVGLGDGTIVQKYGGLRGVPTTIVIGPEGKIRGRITGMATKEMLRPGLKRLLDEAS